MRLPIVIIALFLLIFFTNFIGQMNEWNVWLSFLACSLLALTSLFVSIYEYVKQQSKLAAFGILISCVICLFIIITYILPEAGIAPAIKLF